MRVMSATFGAANVVIFLSAISLLAVVAVALAAFVETSRREGRAGPRARRSLATSTDILGPP